jgi:hypothetical protein
MLLPVVALTVKKPAYDGNFHSPVTALRGIRRSR